jgi:hypothetical protein
LVIPELVCRLLIMIVFIRLSYRRLLFINDII